MGTSIQNKLSNEDRLTLITYLRYEEFEVIALNLFTVTPYTSSLHLVKDTIVFNLKDLFNGFIDFGKRTEMVSMEESIKDYIFLVASFYLVVDQKIDLRKVYNKPIINNATLFDALKFKLK